MLVFLDLESIPCQKDDIREQLAAKIKPPKNYKSEAALDKWRKEELPVKLEEQYRATALNGGYGEIVCIGLAVSNGEIEKFWSDPEEALLRHFLLAADRAIKASHGRIPLFVGHNVGWDLRFLAHRLAIHGLQPGFPIPYNEPPYRGKYIDTQYLWCGARDYIELKELCNIFGVCQDVADIDGSEVWDMWQAGAHEVIANHCEYDVIRVREVYERLQWML